MGTNNSKVSGYSILEDANQFNAQGAAYLKQGKLTEAIECHKKALAIQEREIPDSLDLSISYSNIGIVYEKQGNLTKAFEYHNKSLAIREIKSPNSLGVARSYANIGTVYQIQGNLTKALESYNKTLVIQEREIPDSLKIATSYNNIGLIYKVQGNLTKALEFLNKALVIQERENPDSLNVSVHYIGIGVINQDQGNLTKALEFYNKALVIQEKEAPDSIWSAKAYNAIGTVYQDQGNLTKSLEFHNKALVIHEKESPDSLSVANSYNNIGSVYFKKEDLTKALEFYNKALVIREIKIPNSLDVSSSYHHIGKCHKRQGNLDEALNLFQKSYKIQQKELIPSHPELIALARNISSSALETNQLDLALEYSNLILEKDPKYKYAHDLKGQILIKQGNLEKALNSFSQALKIDPGYADAKLHRLELLTKISETEVETNNPLSQIIQEVEEAKNLQKTDFDEKYKKELEDRARAADIKNIEIELPKQQYQVGDTKYLSALEGLTQRITANEQRIQTVEKRIDTLESRMDILDKKVYGLSHSMNILKGSLGEIDQKMVDNSSNQEMLNNLRQERAKIKERETHVKEFNKRGNLNLGHYYNALLSEIEASYIAAQAISSGEVAKENLETYSKAANYIGMAASLIPVIGVIAPQIISGIASAAETYQNIKNKNSFLRIKELSPTIEEFDKIALKIAVDITLSNKGFIESLEKGQIDKKGWQDHLGSFIESAASSIKEASVGGLEGLIESFMEKNDTKAKLLGRVDGHKVIDYLQEETVAESLRWEEEVRTDSEYKTRHSVIAEEITASLREMENTNLEYKLSKPQASTKPSMYQRFTQGGKVASYKAPCT